MNHAQVLIATAAVTASLLLGGCGSADPTAPGQPTMSTPTAKAPTAAAVTTPPPSAQTPTPATRLLDYQSEDDNGIRLTSSADTAKLQGAPDDFKAFIAAELAKAQADKDAVCSEKPQINVSKLNTGGWAAGGHFIPQCGGYATLWAKPDGTWQEVWGGQELTDCKTLKKYAFPADVVGDTCLQGSAERPYTP